jgi:hypothetical protein
MRHVGFQYEVKVRVHMSSAEIDMLRKLAEQHYDATCRAAAVPGPSGFLWAAHIKPSMLQESDAVEAWSFRELDIARKILEGANFLENPMGDWRASAFMASAMNDFLRSSQDSINKRHLELIRQ